VRWKNGLGWTTELAVEPPQGEFDWRVSIAVLEGEGMALHVEGLAPVRLSAQGEALRFTGEVATRCQLLQGPTRDFNVMTRRGVVEHTLEFRRVIDPLALASGCTWLIYVARGEIAMGASKIASGDAVLIEPDDGMHACVDPVGTADLVLVRITPS
jgi:environmental stress-induced protein Ves